MDSQQAYIARLAHYIAEVLIPKNPEGFTFDPLTFQTLPAFDGEIWPDIHLASIEGHERVFFAIPSFAEVHSWLLDNFERLCVYGNFIGFWEHNGEFYLDVTNAIYRRERAIAFGNSNGQLAIFHPYSKNEIPIENHEGTTISDGTLVTWLLAILRFLFE